MPWSGDILVRGAALKYSSRPAEPSIRRLAAEKRGLSIRPSAQSTRVRQCVGDGIMGVDTIVVSQSTKSGRWMTTSMSIATRHQSNSWLRPRPACCAEPLADRYATYRRHRGNDDAPCPPSLGRDQWPGPVLATRQRYIWGDINKARISFCRTPYQLPIEAGQPRISPRSMVALGGPLTYPFRPGSVTCLCKTIDMHRDRALRISGGERGLERRRTQGLEAWAITSHARTPSRPRLIYHSRLRSTLGGHQGVRRRSRSSFTPIPKARIPLSQSCAQVASAYLPPFLRSR
ncbi:hypothetical protein GGR52DRAFT_248727 [Hypoxylon sp. FL1284]|nr:hypothetical protein GGR52DRAFT_248727 [Hypoxylon sp. FL1284]